MPEPGALSGNAFCLRLIFRGQTDLCSGEKLDLRQFGCDTCTLEAALGASAGLETQQVLVVEMLANRVEIRLERNRSRDAQVVRFGAGLLRKATEIPLSPIGHKETARTMASVGEIDGPNVDVLFLRALDRRVKVRTRREIAVEVVNAR